MAKPFTKEFVLEMKQQLEAEREKLFRELSQFGAIDPNNPQSFTLKAPEIGGGEEESAAESTTFGDNLAVAEELRGALKDVVSALDRITKGTYGICKYCEQPIDERRLRARPASASCIECKKLKTQEV